MIVHVLHYDHSFSNFREQHDVQGYAADESNYVEHEAATFKLCQLGAFLDKDRVKDTKEHEVADEEYHHEEVKCLRQLLISYLVFFYVFPKETKSCQGIVVLFEMDVRLTLDLLQQEYIQII